MILDWRQDGDRLVAYCGEAAVGAIFLSTTKRMVRFRVWVTKNMNPVESRANSVALAKLEVEKRFEAFLDLAQLTRRVS